MTRFKKISRNTLEVLILVIAFLLVNVTSQIFQKPISLNKGRGWDGIVYYSVAEQFLKGQQPRAGAPFGYRIGTPLLVSLFFKEDLLLGFKMVNLLANGMAVFLLLFWLRLNLFAWEVRVILVLLFITQWHGPVRFVYFYPVYVDPWTFVFLLAGLIGIHKAIRKPGWPTLGFLGLVSLVGVLFREAMMVVPIALLFATNPIRYKSELFSEWTNLQVSGLIKGPPAGFLIPVVFAVLGFWGVRQVVIQINDYSFLETALYWAYEKPLLAYLHAWFITFGPLIFLPIYNWRRSFSYLMDHQFLLVYLMGFGVLAWIGGSDTERILYWALPVVYLLSGKSMEDHRALLTSPGLMTVLVGSQLISQRVFWTLPDLPNPFPSSLPLLTVPGNQFPYMDLWSYHGERMVEFVSLLQYLFLGVLLSGWLNYRANIIKTNRV
jgi:hypothetical protein